MQMADKGEIGVKMGDARKGDKGKVLSQWI